jgi:hypothetical protein
VLSTGQNRQKALVTGIEHVGMDRRRFVAALVIGSAGCLSGLPPAGNGTNDRDSTMERPAETSSSTAPDIERTPTGTDAGPTETEPTDAETTDTENIGTMTPEPPEIEAASGDCPGFGEDVMKVVCYDAASDDAPMVMEPSHSSLDLPGEMEFTLHNDTDSRFETNFYSARLHKRVDGEWFIVAPQAVPAPLTPLPAGESHTWTVSMSGKVSEDSTPTVGSGSDTDDTSRRTVGGLGGGRYAFGITGNFRGGSYEQPTAFGATVTVRGDPVELTPTDAVENVTIDGDVLTARWTGGFAESEDARKATYVLERTDKTPDVRLITEQVLQTGGIDPTNPTRDALALIINHDVREVRLTGRTSSLPPFGIQGRIIEYEGTTYRITASETGPETDA